MKRVVWSRRAINHLVAIRDHIAQDSPESAAAIAVKILDAVETLQHFPELGRPGRVDGTRELVISGTSYVIPYRIRGGFLDLLAVFHGRQKWPNKL